MKRGGVIVLEGIRTKPDWEAGKPGVKRKASRKEGSGSLDDWRPLGRTPGRSLWMRHRVGKKPRAFGSHNERNFFWKLQKKKLKVLSRSP